MIYYTVKPGDVIGVLALKFKTTIRILMADNPFIPSNQELKEGWRLTVYTPEENAKRYTSTAYDQIEFAHDLREDLETNDYILSTPTKDVTYKDRKVLDGQIGFVKILTQIPLIEAQANGYEKRVRWLEEGEILRVYEIAYLNGQEMYLVDAFNWITTDSSKVLYDEIPLAELDGKIRLEKKAKFTVRSLMAARALSVAQPTSLVAPTAEYGYGLKPEVAKGGTTPKTYLGFGHNISDNARVKPVMFERPSYRRPMMHLENAAGEKAMIELRSLAVSANYSNAIQQSSTNGGWMINIRAHNLPVLSITGYLLETKANNEFSDFMNRYHKYMAAQKTDDYYGLGISKFFYKQTEYKGIVVGFSYTDREDETFHRKYTMQFLVLGEKQLSSSEYSKLSTVVSRNGMSEEAFRSDIMAMLTNSITGLPYVH